MTFQPLIRKASKEDLQVLFAFEQGVIDAERPFDPTLKPGRVHYYDLEQMISDPGVHLVVAEWQGQLIASGYARILPAKSYLRHDRYAYLGFMFVHPDFRGRGLNALIVNELERWALEKNISELRLEVYAENEAAIRAYERSGFRKLLIEMRKPAGKKQ